MLIIWKRASYQAVSLGVSLELCRSSMCSSLESSLRLSLCSHSVTAVCADNTWPTVLPAMLKRCSNWRRLLHLITVAMLKPTWTVLSMYSTRWRGLWRSTSAWQDVLLPLNLITSKVKVDGSKPTPTMLTVRTLIAGR